ncbi:hypothetical protein QBC35DRAFT_418849 [Podospora australis]|uniref:Uncharacterized protein n=1 Tax=Podospora australis TaxID=1536484 RepID=A0AAN6WKU6_9PEZI|nr:hypothetical protein QBC35DRAFT_418849 [Podospora australis]
MKFNPLFTLGLLPLASAGYHQQPINIATFEEQFINSLPVKSHNNASTITLVGYKSIAIEPEHLPHFEKDYYSNISLWGNNRVYDAANRAIRVYFPVEEALLALGPNGAHVEADQLGQVPCNHPEAHLPKVGQALHVIGRRRTDHVSGVEGNVVRDGIIYLAEPAKPVRHVGRAIVYDFGAKGLHSHDERDGHHPHKRAEAKKGCLENHNGKNCSKTYGISKGRCTMNTKVCMDYNGIVTDCVNHSSGWKKYRNFVESDCDYSLGAGHCWNELM